VNGKTRTTKQIKTKIILLFEERISFHFLKAKKEKKKKRFNARGFNFSAY